MVTDTERREVARRLRAIEPDDFSSYSEEHEFVEKALGIWDDYDKFLWNAVADLIEPSCDRDALLTLADEFESGARVARTQVERAANAAMAIALADEYEANARRIRKAIGVTDEDD